MKNQLIYMDLLFVVEKLLPQKGTISLLRSYHRHLPISTLSLEHYGTASELQFALFKYCPRYAEYYSKNKLTEDDIIDGNDTDIKLARIIISNFIRGSCAWIDHYLTIYNENWNEEQKLSWFLDFKLLTQAIIGVGNCQKASWFIENHSILKTLTYQEHITPFLARYE